MIVPMFDPDVMSNHEHNFDSLATVYGGDVRQLGGGPFEELTNPRQIGFGREEALYIPIYWVTEKP